jgi:hypothetical protein
MTATLAMTLGAVAIVIIIVLLIIWAKLRRRSPKLVQAVLSREEYARILVDNPDSLQRHAALSAGLAQEILAISEFSESSERPSPDTITKDAEAQEPPSNPDGVLAVPTEAPSRQQKREASQTARDAKQNQDRLAEGPPEDEPVGTTVEVIAEPVELTKAQKRAQKAADRAAKKEAARSERAERSAAKKQARAERRASDVASSASEILDQSPPSVAGTEELLTDPFTDGPTKQRRPRRQKKSRKDVVPAPVDEYIAGPSLTDDDFEIFTDTPPEPSATAPSATAPSVPGPSSESAGPDDFHRRAKQKDQELTYVPTGPPPTLEQDEYPPSGIDFDQALEDLIETTARPQPPRPTRDDERFITEEESQNPDVLAPPELSPPPGRRLRKNRNTTAAAHTTQGIDPSELKKASKEAAALTRRQTKESKEARKQETSATKDLRHDELKRSRAAARRRRLALREAAKVERSAKSEEKKSLRGAKEAARTVTTEDAGGVVVTMSEKDFAELEKERRRLSRIAISDARKAERALKRNKGAQPLPELGAQDVPTLQEHTLAEPEKAPEGSSAQKRESLRAMRAITKAERESVREGTRIEKKRKAEERQRSRALSQLTQMQSGRRTPARLRAIDRRARKLGLNQSAEAPRYSFDKETGDIIYSGADQAPQASSAPALRYDWRSAGLPEPLPERGD